MRSVILYFNVSTPGQWVSEYNQAYDSTHSLLSDLLDFTFEKYKRVANAPIRSPTMDELGELFRK